MTRSNRRVADHDRASRGRANRHRLVVLGCDTTDTVVAAGGLLFDRRGGGWSVGVYLQRPAEGRALDILGVTAGPLREGMRTQRSWPDALVVSGDLLTRDDDVRRLFVAAASRPHTEVALWGGGWPDDASPCIGRVEHVLSSAASAFKAHALVAAGRTSSVEAAESFWSGKRRLAVAAPLSIPG